MPSLQRTATGPFSAETIQSPPHDAPRSPCFCVFKKWAPTLGPKRIAVLAAILLFGAVAPLTDAKAHLKIQPYEPTSEGKEAVTWIIDPIAPAFYMKDGEIAGYGAAAIDWFIRRIAHHKVNIVALPRGRAFEEMRATNFSTGRTVCIAGTLKTPDRAKTFFFSKTVISQFPISIITRADRKADFAPFLNDEGAVDLKALIAHAGLFSLLESDRSYGPRVDAVLSDSKAENKLQQTRLSVNMIKMLELRRLDWFLAYPIEAEFHRMTTAPALEIASFPIAGAERMLDVKLACSATRLGRHIINHVDNLMMIYPDMPWAAGYVHLLSAEDKARYHQLTHNQRQR